MHRGISLDHVSLQLLLCQLLILATTTNNTFASRAVILLFRTVETSSCSCDVHCFSARRGLLGDCLGTLVTDCTDMEIEWLVLFVAALILLDIAGVDWNFLTARALTSMSSVGHFSHYDIRALILLVVESLQASPSHI